MRKKHNAGFFDERNDSAISDPNGVANTRRFVKIILERSSMIKRNQKGACGILTRFAQAPSKRSRQRRCSSLENAR